MEVLSPGLLDRVALSTCVGLAPLRGTKVRFRLRRFVPGGVALEVDPTR